MNTNLLRRFYDWNTKFYVLVRGDKTTIMVESPEDQDEPGENPETILRLWMSREDALLYKRMASDGEEVSVVLISLESIWNGLEKIQEIALTAFSAPIRVEVDVFDEEGDIEVVDVLSSSRGLQS